MKWQQVRNEERVQPEGGSYTDWKDEIAAACGRQCVYCAISEARYGGIDNFHVEHFRPKSLFPKYTLTITNLYLACAICNRFKSNDWPAEPVDDHSVVAYPDPGAADYNDVMDVAVPGFSVAGNVVASQYVVERVYLNRPQLIRERRVADAEQRIRSQLAYLQQAADQLMQVDPIPRELLVALVQQMSTTWQSYMDVQAAPPYTREEIRRT